MEKAHGAGSFTFCGESGGGSCTLFFLHYLLFPTFSFLSFPLLLYNSMDGEERLAELNALYKEHESAIDSIQSALQREIPLLVQEHELSLEETAALDEYIHDRGKYQDKCNTME